MDETVELLKELCGELEAKANDARSRIEGLRTDLIATLDGLIQLLDPLCRDWRPIWRPFAIFYRLIAGWIPVPPPFRERILRESVWNILDMLERLGAHPGRQYSIAYVSTLNGARKAYVRLRECAATADLQPGWLASLELKVYWLLIVQQTVQVASDGSEVGRLIGELRQESVAANRRLDSIEAAFEDIRAFGRSKGRWLADAMLQVRDHPEWSDAEIARQVRVNPSTLSRSPEYQAAAAMARGDKACLPKGQITVDPDDRRAPRRLEAVEPDDA